MLLFVHRRAVADRVIVGGFAVVAVTCTSVRLFRDMAFEEMPRILELPLFDLDRFAFGVALAVMLRSGSFEKAKH